MELGIDFRDFGIFEVIVWLLIAYVTMGVAVSKGYPSGTWFVIGLVLGPLGLVFIGFAQTQKPVPVYIQVAEGEPVDRLLALGEMLKSGLITSEEFEKQKVAVLAKNPQGV